jgi:TRAP-type C4-dicarboxylate transport system permease small subunit
MKNVFKAIWKGMCWVDTVFPCIGVGLMGIILFYQIIMRYLFNTPLSWSEELARYMYVWVCFIGLGYCVRHHTNIRMEALQKLLPASVRKGLNICLNFLTFGVFSLLLPYSIRFANAQFGKITPALGIPKGFVTISVPIGIVFLLINVIVDTVKLIQSPAEECVISGSQD